MALDSVFVGQLVFVLAITNTALCYMLGKNNVTGL